MKKWMLLLFAFGALFSTTQAQDDDLYFVSSKKNIERDRALYGLPRDTYYSGSDRSIDEYNRRGGSSYQYISGDSTMNDVIDFSGGAGVYPDSTADFNLTRKMSRWDGYTPTDAYWQGYDQGRSDEWAASSWHSPWYYSSYYYPWYDSWYDPWYYDRWYWRDPWYYRHSYYYSWNYRPYYYHYSPSYYHHYSYNSYYRPSTGTQSHGRVHRLGSRGSSSGIGAGRSTSAGSAYSRNYGRTTGFSRSVGSSGTIRSSSGSIGSTRSSSGSFGSTRSSSGSIGSSRSSGGSINSGSSFGRSGGSRSAGRR